MQIRLTVLAPRGGQSAAAGPVSGAGSGAASGGRAGSGAPAGSGSRGRSGARACDVLVTAPAGTALAAVASALATAVAGPDTHGAVVVYAGEERLDAQRRVLGEPPLVDGAVLSLQLPGEAGPTGSDGSAQLHVVAGPDAGGVHLLHGGRITVGRSASADVPLDDPDVSRLHCEVTIGDDGRVTVADLGSTNGTALDGRPVGPRPVRLPLGALLRLGESTLRLTPGDRTPPLATVPDGEGHLRVPAAAFGPHDEHGEHAGHGEHGGHEQHGEHAGPDAQGHAGPGERDGSGGPGERGEPGERGRPDRHDDREQHGRHGHPDRAGHRDPRVSRVSHISHDGHGAPDARAEGARRAAGRPPGGSISPPPPGPAQEPPAETPRVPAQYAPGRAGDEPDRPVPDTAGSAPDADGTHAALVVPAGRPPRKRGIGAWARRFAGGREEPAEETAAEPGPPVAAAPVSDLWPDPAAVLLTALGPGPRLWERGPAHPEALVLRLGTADRDGLCSVPVTVGLREAGSLGLAGPRERLAGTARAAVAQLAALHAPADLEIVLISADRRRSLEERRAEWAWIGWLPHLRPAHGQDCRLLLAYDNDQAAARAAELTRRLDDGPLGPGWPSADRAAVERAAAEHRGPRTVVVVDGDPGSAALRETTARLAGVGPAAGIHLIVLAETPAASPLSPMAATYETACEASLPFRECGAVAILSGDVATALRLLRTAGGLPAGQGVPAAVDAVSAAWAERFGRALAPLRTEGSGPGAGPATSLPRTARLLDELGLARATPASLMARWASGTSDGALVLGAGPSGPVVVDLTEDSPHLLIEGPPGSGRTELLRSVAASLAAAGRPDRVGLLLVDGAGGGRGDGLSVCTELPHVTEHLVASDPVRMRAFAQALGAELKRRAELLGGIEFAESQNRRQVTDRVAGRRPPAPVEQRDAAARGDLDSPPSGTLRLRPGARRVSSATSERPLPRLVVLVDDFDALVAPALGSTGRPAAGSVVRALEAVARDGGRLGVHLVTTSARPELTADTEPARHARLRVVLDAPPASAGPDDPVPGRGRLGRPDGRVVPFQGGRVTGRIPRTATLRPTVVPLEWERMGDPPTRRPLRELGNGPTDLALLASALERAAHLVDAAPVPPLSPVHP
ncbi:FtsK/SpoIIIE domain-containing protein [Streptomyces sp. NPDC014894]|uniref:FtsK/SpoIIIE domain-containing protein n=1 Tax=Streptomyces sp. NPDC014894 TaxID=3364931 RepID=UPI0036FB613B